MSNLIYGIDDVPPIPETLALGFQHYLTMFGSTVAIPLFLGPAFGIPANSTDMAALMATMFFVSGITTLLQTTFGNRLPIVQGGTFSFLAPTFAICGMASLSNAGWEVRMQHVQGAIILGAIVEIVMGATGLAGRVLKYVGPITIAPTIALIGLALFEYGAPVAGKDWWMGGLTIFLIILFSQILRHKHRAFELYPILLALLIAWGVAAALTAAGVFGPGHPSHVSLDNVRNAPYFRLPTPFQWGWPQFGAAAFMGMLAGYLASVVESIGDYYACARMAGAPEPDAKLVNRGITFEGIGCLIAGIFGTGNGTTSYSENIGAIGLTRVASRRVVQAGAVIMLLLGCVGKFGALFTTIPQPIVGGMYCALFGMIAAVGLSNLQRVDLNSSRNLFILGFAFFMGLSMPFYVKNNPISFSPPPAHIALADTAKVNPDAGALATLGLKPEATVGQAKAARDRLLAIYVTPKTADGAVPATTPLKGINPARAKDLDAAVKALANDPPPPLPLEPIQGEGPVYTGGSGMKDLGLSNEATVDEASKVRDEIASLYRGPGALPGTDPAHIGRLNKAFASVGNRPVKSGEESTKDAFLAFLANMLNTIGVNGMAIAAMLALILDNVVPGTREERGLAISD
ncbi:MAG: solute carrier family 23 protein [Planctomycetes bacterium]|nr:solute carrier family 23 protein [Planctomycetota bacterium]